MKAALLTKYKKPLEIVDLTLSNLVENEVRVRVLAASVCHTDLTMHQGLFPFPVPSVIGHEVTGVVEAVGAGVHRLKPGDSVVGFPVGYCGYCPSCNRGDTYLCSGEQTLRPDRVALDGTPIFTMGGFGAFAEEIIGHEHSFVQVPKALPPQQATLLGCGVSTGLGAALHTAPIKPGDCVVVIGCGAVGLSVIQGARIVGATRIIAVDLAPGKLDVAKALGATDCLNASEQQAPETVLEMTSGGADVAFECVGKPETTAQAVQMIRRGGTTVLVGMMELGASINIPGTDFLTTGKRLVASVLGETRVKVDIDRYVALIESGELNLDPLISRRFTLDEINDALESLESGQVIKPVIAFGDLS